MPFLNFYQQTFLAIFYLIFFSFILFRFVMWELIIRQSLLATQISPFKIHSFKPLQCTCEINNRQTVKVSDFSIFLISIHVHIDILLQKKALARIRLRQIKRIEHDNFSACLLNTKSCDHGITVFFHNFAQTCFTITLFINFKNCYSAGRILVFKFPLLRHPSWQLHVQS